MTDPADMTNEELTQAHLLTIAMFQNWMHNVSVKLDDTETMVEHGRDWLDDYANADVILKHIAIAKHELASVHNGLRAARKAAMRDLYEYKVSGGEE